MRYYQPDSWMRRVIGAVLLLVGIAVGARVVYGLLVPLVPAAFAVAALAVVYLVVFQRWRR